MSRRSPNAARQSPPGSTARKRWLFRLLAVACGVAPFVVLEVVFAVFGWCDPRLDHDPYVGFEVTRPLFVLDETRQTRVIPASRLNWFCEEAFPAQKPDNEFRIFCLGGSTVQGRPFAKQTAFSTWLELGLNATDSTRDWRVINCGGVSYASYRLAPMLDEVLEYSPDLIVLYTGHNEFLEDRSYDHIRDRSPAVKWLERIATRSRVVTFLRQTTRPWFKTATRDQRTRLTADVDALLDHSRGLDDYHRDGVWRQRVVEHFQFNLRRMIASCRGKGVPILLINPVSNLRDCPPFKALNRDDLTPQEKSNWSELVRKGRESLATDLWQATSYFQQARKIDSQHAGLHYQLARCFDRTGRRDLAKEAYLAAKEQDICPLRMLESMHLALLSTTSAERVPCYDARRELTSRSPDGLVGNFLMLDHVHPSVKGHQQIAEGLLAMMQSEGLVNLAQDWRETVRGQYAPHLESLDRDYFLQGLARLEGLQRWARQRVNILDEPPKDRP